jgi:hypothetical protein
MQFLKFAVVIAIATAFATPAVATPAVDTQATNLTQLDDGCPTYCQWHYQCCSGWCIIFVSIPCN